MTVRVRPLADDELPAAWELGRLAFGGRREPPPEMLRPVPGILRLGAFDDRGRLVGKATDTGHEQWWGGRRLATADVGGVAVAPEARGTGVARAVLTDLLARARERGAAVSALFPTVSAPYRSLGWEVAGELVGIDLDAAALTRGRAPGTSVRPGRPGDLPAVTDLYERIAWSRSGLLTRRGGAFDLPSDGPWPNGADGATLVEQDGVLTGALVYRRGSGYGSDARLTADDLLATTPEAAHALVGVLGSWATVTPTVRLPLLRGDAVSALLPLERARPVSRDVWMHRPVDVVRAVADRGWPTAARGRVAFRLADDVAPWNAGDWELVVEDGGAELRVAGREPDLWLTVRGFAVLYCGASSGCAAVQAGLAGGADPARLDLLAAGPRAELLDYF
ncbi:GNAT family N-acetyltransferase [Geodermatophilus sp. YIM 151500]|uniref:GNAT family N-acetyltransferase n=1 Tax=Geodermatophilus sp. YIM 151500 TaxID=2984531 RepID=UPI0021E36814|nr:GNAT family N-acetyltransferase [Geodermatophilus sp. YIM 151500]MCV2490091.1 GNAT family N-acetyltransferase [Geodermatophilus sp. YIM 151500]